MAFRKPDILKKHTEEVTRKAVLGVIRVLRGDTGDNKAIINFHLNLQSTAEEKLNASRSHDGVNIGIGIDTSLKVECV